MYLCFVDFFTQYYLKAKFHFNKDQFADLMIISGVAGSISQVNKNSMLTLIATLYLFKYSVTYEIILQLIFMPILVPALKEQKLLQVGLFFGCAHVNNFS